MIWITKKRRAKNVMPIRLKCKPVKEMRKILIMMTARAARMIFHPF